jgi:DNA-binding MarR family transcriptional regulator
MLRDTITDIEGFVQRASGKKDLILAQWLILVHLLRIETCKQSALMAKTSIAPGYLTRLLDVLEAKRLIQRHRSAEDRRTILLSATDHGRKVTRDFLSSLLQSKPSWQLGSLCELKSSIDVIATRFSAERTD